MTNENTTPEVALTAEEMAVIGRHLGLEPLVPDSDGEAAHEEAQVFVTEDTTDHVVH